nr:expressed conserved protein [Hymenolepis microstoma]
MQASAGVSSPVSGRSSPQNHSLNEDDPFFRQSVNIPPLRKIKVVVVEEHSMALRHIYRTIGSKKLPSKGIKLLHFDAHPDLCIPNISPSVIIDEPYGMLNSLSIENWIFPAVFSKFIDHVLWLHPPWSKQMTNRRTTDYVIGRRKTTDELAVNVPEPYFYNEGIYCHRCDMESEVTFSFTVCTIHGASTLCNVCSDVTMSLLNEPFVLDVDLDAFSTMDPFRSFFSPNQFALIDKLFTAPRAPPLRLPDRGSRAPPLGSTCSTLEVFESASLAAKVVNDIHRQRLSALLQCMESLTTSGTVEFSTTPSLDKLDAYDIEALTSLLLSLPIETFSPSTYFNIQTAHALAISVIQETSLTKLSEDQLQLSPGNVSPHGGNSPEPPKVKQQKVDTSRDCLDWTSDSRSETVENDLDLMKHFHDLWKSLADRENYPLPHHVSTVEEQSELIGGLESLLNRMHNPSLITIARSSLDGYTPTDQVSSIQMQFFEALQRIYGVELLTVALDYDGAAKDAQALQLMGFEISEIRGEISRFNSFNVNPGSLLLSRCEASGDYRSESDTRDIS